MNLDYKTLHKIRKALRLTLDEMGALMGMTGVMLHHIEKGNRRLKREHIDRLAQEIGLTDEKVAALVAAYDAEEAIVGHKERAQFKVRKVV
jgi:transcriptional regulator with XRE-family HTH domain